jgi:tape measure domain-containing protein
MPTIGVADILIRPTFKNLQQTVGRELDGVATSEGTRAGSSMGSALGGALKTGAVAVAGGAVAALGVALTKGFGRLQAIEEAKAKLSGLGHSVESVTGIMNDAMASVKGTAFGLDEAASVAAGVVASGIKPGKDLQRVLRLVGDSASIAGVGLGEMGAIWNKAAASNKVQGDILAQLGDAGIPIVQLLGKELGKTAEEVYKMSEKGQIDFATFANAMESGLGGAALKSGETLKGAFKNTMASVGRIGASLLSGVYPKIQQFFAGAIEWMKPLEEGAKIAGAAIGTFLDKTLAGAQGLYDLMVKGDFTGKLTAAFGWEEDSPLVDFLLKVRDGAQGLYDLLITGDFTGKLTSAFGWEEDSRFVDFLLTIRDEVKKIPDALQKVIDTSKDVAKWLWDMRAPIGIIVGLIVVSLIPHWVALGVEAMKSAVQQKIAWTITQAEAIKAAFTHSWAVVAMVGGWLLMGAQATIQAVKIAAAWLIAMGPVGWIIAGIAALVAGFVWAYNNIGWFRDGVDAAMRWVSEAVTNSFQWIQDAIGAVVSWFTDTAMPAWNNAIKAVGGFFSWLWTDIIKPVFDNIASFIQSTIDGIGAVFTWLYESIIKPVFDGIAAAVKFVGDVFTALYLTYIKPVFDSIGVIVGGFYLFFRGIFQLIVSLITYIVIPLFMAFWNRMVEAVNGIGAIFNWLYENAVKPVFDGIGSVISWVWDNVLKPVFDAWAYMFQVTLPAVFTWLYESVIRPVFDGIGDAVKWVWDNVLKPTFDAWLYVFQTVIPNALNWLHDSVIKPVFDAIGNAAKWVWETLLKPVFDAWVNVFTVILPNAFNWLYNNAIKPVFDNIGNTIKWVWDNVIKPVFDTLSDFITKTIPKAFEDGVGFIKTAWDKLQEIAKMPVRFVVDTVINDGLIGAFNTVAGILPGIDKLPRVALPAGFMNGGYTGNGAKDEPAGIVHGGEFVFTKEQTRKAGVANLYAMAKSLAGYAKGGFVNPLKQMIETQGYNRIHKGVDYAASVGTPVFATENGRVSWSGPGVQAPGVWGGNEVHVDGGSGIQSWFAHLSSMAVKVGDMVRAGQQIALSGNTGITSGPHLHFGTFAGGWPNDVDPHGYLSGAGAPSGGGFNPLAGIIDGLLAKFREAFPAAGMIADLAIGIGKKLFGSVSDLITGGRGSAAGPALYDLGGILPPGISQVVNRTGKPEAILNPRQWADISRLAAGNSGQSHGGFNNYGEIHVRDETELARVILNKQRDAQAVYQ